MHYFWVGLGGFFGAAARYGVGRLCASLTVLQAGDTGPAFPWATLLVNVLGSFAIGVLALLLHRSWAAEEWRLLLMVGFLGAFTTFSSFSLETLTLLQGGAGLRALFNVLANVVLCLLAVVAGYTVGRQLAVS